MANYDKQGDGCHLADAEGQIEESGIGVIAAAKKEWKVPEYLVRSIADTRGGTVATASPDATASPANQSNYKAYS